MLFGRRLLDEAAADWVFDRTGWLISTLGPRNFFDHTRLVLPTRSFFPETGGNAETVANAVFDTVRSEMGIAHWPAKLVPRAVIGPSADTAPFAPNAVAGTYYHTGAEAVITYDPRLLKHRSAFIGTIAHELAHYVLGPHAETAPGGDAEHEMLTDLMVVMAGFGVLDLRGARQVGWQGYLGLEARCFALAIFLDLKEIGLPAARHHLDAWLSRRLERGKRQLRDYRTQLGYLRALRP